MVTENDPIARQALAPFEEALAAYRTDTARADEDDARRAAAFADYTHERDQRDAELTARSSSRPAEPPDGASPAESPVRQPRPTHLSLLPVEFAGAPGPAVASPGQPPPAPTPQYSEPPPAGPAAAHPREERGVLSFRPPDVESEPRPPRSPRRAGPTPDEDNDDMSGRTWMR